MKILFITIIFILIIFISYLVLNKKNIETFIDNISDSSTDIELPIDNKYLPTNTNLNINARNESNKDYAIINIYSTILNRQPSSSEFIKARNLSENELKLQLLNAPEYNHMINMQNNDADPSILAAIAKEDLLLKIKNIYLSEKNTDINPKMLLPVRDCMIHMQYNEYLLRAMFNSDNYDTFEKDVLNTKGLNKDKLLDLFNSYFDLMELKLAANNIIKYDKINNNFKFNPDTLVPLNNGTNINNIDDNYFDKQSKYINNNANNLFNKDKIATNLPTYDNTITSTKYQRLNDQSTTTPTVVPSQNNASITIVPSTSLTLINSINTLSPIQNGNFGWSYCIFNNTMVIGAPRENGDNSGNVYIYSLNNSVWSLNTTLKSPNSIPNGSFGNSCAIYNNTIIIGDKNNVYIYTLNNSIWTVNITILKGGIFSIYNNTIIVQINDTFDSYLNIYTLINSIWSLNTTLRLPKNDSDPLASFGSSCCIYNNTIVISGTNEKVYIYTLNNSVWTLNTTLTSPYVVSTPGTPGFFGNSCSIYNNTIVIGAPIENSDHSGNVYIYTLNNSIWTLNTTLKSPNSIKDGMFGTYCSIYNNTIVITEKSMNSNKLYIYKLNNSIWQLYSTISSPIYGENILGNGNGIYINNNTILINTSGKIHEGVVNIYTLPNSVEQFDTISNDNNLDSNDITIEPNSHSYQYYKKVFNPIKYQQEYRGMPQYRPNICTSLNQPQLTQPVFTESKLLFQGTSLDQAFEDTQVGSIMPKFEYREYEFIKA